MSFLQSDKTDELPYMFPTFVCDNFADALQAAAKKAGWRCAKVNVDLSGYSDPLHFGIAPNTGHSCNAFYVGSDDTICLVPGSLNGQGSSGNYNGLGFTFRGPSIVFIDDTGAARGSFAYPKNCDKIVDVAIGKDYVPVSLFPEDGWKNIWDGMGEVTKIDIKW